MLITTAEELQKLQRIYAQADGTFEEEGFLIWAIQRGRQIPDDQKIETYRQLLAAGQEG